MQRQRKNERGGDRQSKRLRNLMYRSSVPSAVGNTAGSEICWSIHENKYAVYFGADKGTGVTILTPSAQRYSNLRQHNEKNTRQVKLNSWYNQLTSPQESIQDKDLQAHTKRMQCAGKYCNSRASEPAIRNLYFAYSSSCYLAR